MKQQERKDKKLDIILQAAIDEFSSMPFDKVSVFKIAERADISRASFYCYFKNKEEIYEYIINDIKKDFYNLYIIDKKQEYFELLENLFEFFMKFKNSKKQDFLLQMFEYLKPENINFFACHNTLPYITEMVDYSNFKNKDKNTILMLFKSNFACLGMLIVHYYKDVINENKVREIFNNYINIIKFGAYKQ